MKVGDMVLLKDDLLYEGENPYGTIIMIRNAPRRALTKLVFWWEDYTPSWEAPCDLEWCPDKRDGNV